MFLILDLSNNLIVLSDFVSSPACRVKIFIAGAIIIRMVLFALISSALLIALAVSAMLLVMYLWLRIRATRRLALLNLAYENEMALLSAVGNLRKEPESRYLSRHWFNNSVRRMSPAEFKRHYRMTPTSFEKLLSLLEPHLERGAGGRTPIPDDLALAVVLWRLANHGGIREAATQHGVADSSVSRFTDMFCDAIIDVLTPMYLQFPTHATRERLSNAFARSRGFPGAVGAVDGTYIPLFERPPGDASSYINRHHEFSIVCQAVTDADENFLHVFIGMPGSTHDSRTFRWSGVGELMQSRFARGTAWLLGDSAYQLSPWMIVPYRDNGALSRPDRHFNFMHSSTRLACEHTFGKLKVDGVACLNCMHAALSVRLAL